MTKEEKEAIEKLSTSNKRDLISILRTFKKEGIENFAITRRRYIDTVLNLIQEQQKDIDLNNETEIALNNKIMDLEEALKIVNNNVKCLDKQAQEYFETIMFKDKIIDLMAETIYFSDFIEFEICQKIDCKHIELQNEGRCIGKDCVKQYFENKAKESK